MENLTYIIMCGFRRIFLDICFRLYKTVQRLDGLAKLHSALTGFNLQIRTSDEALTVGVCGARCLGGGLQSLF